MTKQYLAELVECGREIEFKYQDKDYSITYGVVDGVQVISFCEFYKDTTEVTSFEDLLQVSRDGVTVLEMWETLTEENVWIF